MKSRSRQKALARCVAILLTAWPTLAFAATATKIVPEGTRVYLKLDQSVSGKRGAAQAGDMVQCEVWRDVELQGVLLVRAGTHAICKVESVKHANIAGIKGKLVIAAMETRTIDGQPLQLTGGYNKEGKSHMVLSISLGAIVFLPLILITGNSAELPEGTVFDAYSGPEMPVVVASNDVAVAYPAIRINAAMSSFSAEVILDDFMKPDSQPDVFRIRLTKRGALPKQLMIDNVNGAAIEPIPLEIASTKSGDGSTEAIATVKVKTLAKHFQKGINHFEVAFTQNGERVAAETILNIQM